MSIFANSQCLEEMIRCTSCNKLVAKSFDHGHLQIKCSRCGSFNEIFETMIEHVAIANPDGVLLFTNKAMEAESGFSVDESIGKKPSDLWGGNMSSEFYAEMWRVLRDEKKPFRGVVQNMKKSGEPYNVEVSISPIFSVSGEAMFYVCIGTAVGDAMRRGE